PRAYPNDFLHRSNEDLPIADFSCSRAIGDYFHDLSRLIVGDQDLNLHLRQKVHRIFGTPIKLGVSLCRPNPFTSSTVIPCMPALVSASFTSSSLNGFTIASTIFIEAPLFCR